LQSRDPESRDPGIPDLFTNPEIPGLGGPNPGIPGLEITMCMAGFGHNPAQPERREP